MDILQAPTTPPSNEQLASWRQPTPLLDYDHATIQTLVQRQVWLLLSEYERIGAVYNFVRDDIVFGYNASDDLPASQVLADGIGQCNTKGTLLMALLRAVGVACRFHGFTIDKALQKGAITGVAYQLAPRSIIHSWVEICSTGQWIRLEGFILDRRYLKALQSRFTGHQGPFCGYGAATPNLQCPPVDWVGKDTFIQKDGINHDFGLFDSPDDFYAQHGVNLSGVKRSLYAYVIRHAMNRNVAHIREKL